MLYFYLFIYLFIYLSIYLSIHLSIYLSICLFYLFIYLFILAFLLYVLLNYYHSEEGPKRNETFVLLELGFFFFKKYRFIKHAMGGSR